QRQLRIGREGRPAIAKSRSAAAADTTAAETASPREQYLSEVERSCAWIAPSCYYDCVRGESVRFWPASGHSLHCSTNRLPATPATAQGTRAGFRDRDRPPESRTPHYRPARRPNAPRS